MSYLNNSVRKVGRFSPRSLAGVQIWVGPGSLSLRKNSGYIPATVAQARLAKIFGICLGEAFTGSPLLV